MKILFYIKEIKYRFFLIFFNIFLNFSLLTIYYEQVIYVLGYYQTDILPYFVSTSLTEIFLAILKINIFLSIYFTLPIFFLQTWFFVTPALYKFEYKRLCLKIMQLTICYIGGVITLHGYLIPYCWEFFSNFEFSNYENFVGIYMETHFINYVDFVMAVIIVLNVAFVLSIVAFEIFKRLGIKKFIKFRKIFTIIFFFFATVFTPPDVFSQLLTATVLFCLYEFFIFLSFFLHAKKKRVLKDS